jgi:hypothetical protein
LLEWSTPRASLERTVREDLQPAKTFVRVILISAVAIVIVWLYGVSLIEIFSVRWPVLVVGVIGFATFPFVAGYLMIRFPTQYRITNKKILGGRQTVRWRWLKSYQFTTFPGHADSLLLILNTRFYTKVSLLVPVSLRDQIEAIMESKNISKLADEEFPPDLLNEITNNGATFLYLFSLLYSLAYSEIAARLFHYVDMRLLAAVIMIFGPGTLGILILFGRRIFKASSFPRMQAAILAFCFNAGSLTMCMILSFTIVIHRLFS